MSTDLLSAAQTARLVKTGEMSALEVTERLRNAAASGLSKGRSDQLGRDSERELSREKARAIDIGI